MTYNVFGGTMNLTKPSTIITNECHYNAVSLTIIYSFIIFICRVLRTVRAVSARQQLSVTSLFICASVKNFVRISNNLTVLRYFGVWNLLTF